MTYQATIDLIRALSPEDADRPPSRGRWVRALPWSPRRPWEVVEIRDPNEGTGTDPSLRSRHQYMVAAGTAWSRRLPPAPLSKPDDESPWADDPHASEWRLWCPSGPLAEWARAQGWDPLRQPSTTPILLTVEDTLDGGRTWEELSAWTMPPRSPTDAWAAVTGAPCPVPDCDQTLVWYEAGYVPGYRVCMAQDPDDPDCFSRDSLRHRFCLCHWSDVPPWTLVLVGDDDEDDE